MKYLKLIRLKHWIKNTFLFIPLFFSGRLDNFNIYGDFIIGFFSFSFIASAVYIFNDYNDVEADRKHPKKKFRPIASGEISKNIGISLCIILMIKGFAMAIFLNPKFAFVLAIYLFLNLIYTAGLKNISILDIIIVAIGFVLRIKSGAIIGGDIFLSHWIIVMVFLLALFIAVAKRRDDLVLKAKLTSTDLRQASRHYSMEFLNIAMSLLSGIIIVSYLMYTLSPEVNERMGTHRLFYTSLFVIAGIFRYLQIALVENNTGSPTELLYKDRFIQIVLLFWIISFYMLIYFKDVTLFS